MTNQHRGRDRSHRYKQKGNEVKGHFSRSDKPHRHHQQRPKGGSDTQSQSTDSRHSNSSRSKENSELKAQPKHKPQKIKFGVVFYENLQSAKAELDKIVALAKDVDQLNIVIKTEGIIEDPELAQYGKVFSGAAWNIIHTRRQADGFYDNIQEI